MILLDEPDRANIWENYFRVSGLNEESQQRIDQFTELAQS